MKVPKGDGYFEGTREGEGKNYRNPKLSEPSTKKTMVLKFRYPRKRGKEEGFSGDPSEGGGIGPLCKEPVKRLRKHGREGM